MTKEQIVELVFLRVHGGKTSSDVNIKRPNISFFFEAAYNYAILFDYYERHNLMLSERRIMGYSDQSKLLEQQLCTYPVTTQYDETRKLCYVTLPADLMVMPGGRGLDSIFGGTDGNYVKVNGQEYVDGLDPIGASFFWFEKYPNEARVYIKGNNCKNCDLFVRMMVSASSIGSKDEVQLPAGREKMILDLMAEWFTGERLLPENVVNENVDDIKRSN